MGLPFKGQGLGLGLYMPPGASHLNLPCLNSSLCSMGLATPACEDSYENKSEATHFLCVSLYLIHYTFTESFLYGCCKGRQVWNEEANTCYAILGLRA